MEEIISQDLKLDQKYNQSLGFGSDYPFLPSGIELDQNDIELIDYWKIKKVTLLDDITVPGTNSQDSFKGESAPYIQALKTLEAVVDKFFDDIRLRGTGVFQPVSDSIKDTIDIIKRNRYLVILILNCLGTSRKTESKIAVETAVYSTVIGLQIKLDDEKLKLLFECAILVNLGMLNTNLANIAKKANKLNSQEVMQIQQHPVNGYHIVKNKLKLPNIYCLTVLTHHENVDGTGYPRKLTSEKIPLNAKIISVAQEFVALRQDRPYRVHFSLYNAMRVLISEGKKKFDHTILTCLLANMSLYPIGTIVELNNGNIAVVIAPNPTVSMRPVVKEFLDKYKKPMKSGQNINLVEKKDIQIKTVINSEKLQNNIFDYL
jgi:HD-GYP domain-containing protein (c-di-GMP phosphodiesterase class II)